MSADYRRIRWARIAPDCYVRSVLAALMVIAAITKGLSPGESARAVFDGMPFVGRLLIVQAELAFGVILASGLWRCFVHDAAMLVFTVFALIAMRSVLSGEESCGCFGAAVVDPRVILLIDLLAVAALLATRRGGGRLFYSAWKRVRLVVVVITLMGVPLGFAMSKLAPVHGVAVESVDKFVLLEPETWVGKKLPLLEVLEGKPELASGVWVVLMHHHGCSDCQRVMPGYERRLIRGERVLLVETPPFPKGTAKDGFNRGFARLPDDRDWFVHTPVEIIINDGVVVSVDSELLLDEEAKL
ncbi:MauE/DoxX family redox-associated membrane protein [Botrimarina mediterranea]|uniref:Methylamine utilisation protein MauE domain-containing protein n=1 Tax=Botrimarina mediterranea TaxID=2528022 RepID=A0A518K260_9BACT|nr:MauE/DoxX family redox-associated membrane protein [Botrimarina mediterranea]QDV71896.1 hypothetical protein Spa11_00650 [Botrimarina mediterranea]